MVFQIDSKCFVNEYKGDLITESSDIGLKVGQWPNKIVYKGRVYDFLNFDKSDSGLDIAGANYQALNGQKFLIIND